VKHTFIVTVDTDLPADAQIVMQERMEHDEDYGFPYTVDWEWQ